MLGNRTSCGPLALTPCLHPWLLKDTSEIRHS